jgi:hypothetical protein
VDGDEGGDTEAALVLGADLRARALGAIMTTVMSLRICSPSSTMLKPWLYQRAEPFFIRGMMAPMTGECCLSG